MNKQLAIEWLQGYVGQADAVDEDSALMSNDLDISIEEAKVMVEEFEARLVKLFETWQKDVLLEEAKNKPQTTETDTADTNDA